MMAPPAPEACLVHSRTAKYKGGTLVAEDVRDLPTHLGRLADPDGYRLTSCARCLHAILHVHSYPERQLLADGGAPVVRIAVYICAHGACGATWRVLPLFLARHLWRTWRTVGRVVEPVETPAPASAPTVPARTQRRWRARFASAARQLVVLLATCGGVVLTAIAMRIGLDATRAGLVVAHGRAAAVAPEARLSTIAAIVHRLERGLRLM
jgi:hypothetical protein